MRYNFQRPSGWAQAGPPEDVQVNDLRSEILYLNDRIKSTKKILRNFKTRLRKANATLETRLEHLAILLGPLDRLPPEILSHILTEAAKSSYAFIFLLHINRRIRSIAFSTPALWQTVQFLGSKARPDTLSIPSWISRAGALPLQVSSMVMPWKDEDIRSALLTGCDRIVEIDLQLVDLFRLVQTPVAGLTNLQRLSLANRGSWPFDLLRTENFFFDACPRLTSVSLLFPRATINITVLILPWHQLTTLYLSSLDPAEEILEVLSLCTSLRTLDFHLNTWLPVPSPDDVTILFPYLTSLLLESAFPGDTLSRFLDWLTAPSLTCLSIVFNDGESTVTSSLRDFILDSRCTLESLSLTLNRWEEDDGLAEVISELDSLESLTLKFDHSRCICEIFEMLSPAIFAESGGVHLPNLERFELWASSDLVDLENWLQLGKQRTCREILAKGANKSLSHFHVWTSSINAWTGSETYDLSIRTRSKQELTEDEDNQEVAVDFLNSRFS